MTPAGTSNELDVQNEWEENTHTHTISLNELSIMFGVLSGFYNLSLHEDKFCDILQGTVSSSIKIVIHTSLLYIESNLDRF